MGFQHFDLVELAAEELRREGKIQPRDRAEEVEQDKGRITRRAAYYANQQRDPNLGILEKLTGNNARGYSVDIIIARNGEFWDIVTDDSGEARPVNGDAKSDAGLSNRWRQPTRDLAELGEEPERNGPKPDDNREPGGTKSVDLASKLDALIDLTRQLIQKHDETTKATSDGLERVAKEIREKQIRLL